MHLKQLSHAGNARRRFLQSAASLLTLPGLAASLGAQDPVPVTDPRATDGDERYEPKWDETLTITVGPKQADLVGADDKVIQAACDYIARLGGGTVQLLPGTFTLRNAVFLPSRIRLAGSGPETIITKAASVSVALSADSDWYDQEITLENASGFQVGDGVVLRAVNADHGGQTVIKRTLVARSGNRFKLDRGLRENLWVSGKPRCASLFPLLTSEHTTDVVIENVTLDGNGTNNEHLDGNHAGCVFLQDCARYRIRNVEARRYNGDGISFQICHDVLVEDCHSHDHADLGLHPGSGSQRPVIRGNTLQQNSQGLFWCWGVRHGLAEHNRMVDNRDYGISIGHNDTDNVMRHNEIIGSGKVGILFRDDPRGKDFWANRNRIDHNRIVNSGGAAGIGIDIQGQTRDLEIIGNEILETREPMQRIGVRIGAQAGRVELNDNRIHGLARAVVDDRAAVG